MPFCCTGMKAWLLAVVLVTPLSAWAQPELDYDDRQGAKLESVATSPWLWNAVAVSSDGRIFVGMPRWPGNEKTPGIAELMPDGALVPFPGGAANHWQQGDPTGQALQNVNTVHIFDDDTLWVVDMGNVDGGEPVDNSSQKILQYDIRSRKLLREIHLPKEILPAGAHINDLRRDAENLYITDSGLGGIIVFNLKTEKALRRLPSRFHTLAMPGRPPVAENGQVMKNNEGEVMLVHSDPLEISPDGRWLYFQPLTGPLWRVETAFLRDETLSEDQLAESVEFVFDTPPLVGSAMDSAGNFYMAELNHPRISVLHPDGTVSVLAQDHRLWGPDALFITQDRWLYAPIPQTARQAFTRGEDGESVVQKPYRLYRMKLPENLGNKEAVPPVWK